MGFVSGLMEVIIKNCSYKNNVIFLGCNVFGGGE